MKIKKHHLILVGIIVFAAVLWTIKLGALPLWSDEAHTAFLGKSIGEHALPKAWDGQNLMTGVQTEDSNQDLIITWDQPLQFYLVYASFALFGESNFTARLPFLLAGLLCIPLLYLFVLKFTGNRNLALLSAGILAVSVIFITHARQCRYYSVVAFFALTLFISYLDIIREKRKNISSSTPNDVSSSGLTRGSRTEEHGILGSSPRLTNESLRVTGSRISGYILFTLSLVGLFYSNLLGLVTIFTSLTLYFFIFDFSWKKLSRISLCSIATLPFILPWFFYAKLWTKSGPKAGASIGVKIFEILKSLTNFNRALFPLLIILIIFFLLFRKRLKFDRKYYYFALITILAPLFIAPLILMPAIRYFIYLIPICAFLTALITAEIYKRKKVWAYIFLFVIIFTKLFNNVLITIPQWGLALWGPTFTTYKERIVEKHGTKPSTTQEWLEKTDRRLAHSITGQGILDSIFKIEYSGYINEISNDFRDPIDGVIDFLKANAKPGDEVSISVDCLSMMYYAPEFKYSFVAEPRETNKDKQEILPEYIFSYKNTKWFIPRTIRMIKGPFISEEDYIKYLENNDLKYKVHEIDYLTFNWDGSRPENFAKYAVKHSKRPRNNEKVKIYEVIR